MILFCVRCAMQPVITCLKHESECRDSLDVAAVYVTKVKCVRSYNDSRYSNHFIRTWLLWLVNSLRWSWRKNYVDTWCTFYRMTTCRCARTCRFQREHHSDCLRVLNLKNIFWRVVGFKLLLVLRLAQRLEILQARREVFRTLSNIYDESFC